MNKKLIIKTCLECPLVSSGCKQWESLTPKQKFSITCGVGVVVGILKGCELPDDK